jgi:hypothetical protein
VDTAARLHNALSFISINFGENLQLLCAKCVSRNEAHFVTFRLREIRARLTTAHFTTLVRGPIRSQVLGSTGTDTIIRKHAALYWHLSFIFGHVKFLNWQQL